ncbi:hypothetical protein [Mycobacterium phage WXIN]|nr:hypothetical protein [Mycobacterium phage WXIN]
MDSEWIAVINQWPWLVLVAIFVLGVPHVVKAIRTLKGFLWDPFVAYMRGASPLKLDGEKINAKILGLEEQIRYLTDQVSELRWRDRMYWSWVLSDQSWHRDVELLALEHGWQLPVHISFDAFYDDWLQKHPAPTPYQS